MNQDERKVLILCVHLQRHIDKYRPLFAAKGIEMEAPPIVQQLSEEELLPIIADYDGVIAGDDEFTAAVLEKAEKLKVLVKWGIGVDAIDREAAERLGIRFSNTPGVFGGEVADTAIGYLIMLLRQLHKLDAGVRRGEWPKIPGISAAGKTLGVVGVGDIGQAVCRRAVAMDMNVIGYDIAPMAPSMKELGVRQVGLDELLESADAVCLCCALTAENVGLLGRREFDLMKSGAFLINVSRGPLIDEDALAGALTEGRLAGVALDVFEVEPLPADSPLRDFDNCIFGTHNGSNTVEAVERVNDMAVRILLENLEESS